MRENWPQSQETGFDNGLCDGGQVIVLSGLDRPCGH